ncbi:MAG: type II secretion system protein GspG [Verrucomicrobia bacterium]|nr:type II secretion system protein GspG [Verrucomicrobiota bacterium]
MKLAWFSAIVFACLLGALISYGVRDRLDRRHSIAASNFVADAELALMDYKADHGAFPEGDNEAITAALLTPRLKGESEARSKHYLEKRRSHIPLKTLLDPWNNEMQIDLSGDKASVTSPGVDGVIGTADDVDSSTYLALKPHQPAKYSASTADAESSE